MKSGFQTSSRYMQLLKPECKYHDTQKAIGMNPFFCRGQPKEWLCAHFLPRLFLQNTQYREDAYYFKFIEFP